MSEAFTRSGAGVMRVATLVVMFVAGGCSAESGSDERMSTGATGDVGAGSDATSGAPPEPTGPGASDPVAEPVEMAGLPMAGSVAAPPLDPDADDPTFVHNGYPDIRGTGPCAELSTRFPGDEACLPPPEPGEGIQIHVGPPSYDNPGAYEFPSGAEHSLCKDFVSPNTEDVHYQSSLISARPGTHHIINTCFTAPVDPAGGFGGCRAPGGAGDQADAFPIPGASKPYMPRAVVAPEDQGLADRMPANAQCQADMHYFNFTGSPVLKEFWMNLYTIPPEQVTEQTKQIRGMGGTAWAILPIPAGSDTVYRYQMVVGAPTGPNPRITQLLGHYHAHGVRFSAFLNGEKVFEMFDYNDPKIFTYNSVVENPPFQDASAMSAGATSGPLPLKQGDVLSWECHIINDSTTGLRYTNEVETGEMCNLWGASVDVPKIDAWLP